MNTFSKLTRPMHALGSRLLQCPPARHGHGIRIGIALSGGFARGIAHIGVLKVLEEAGIEVSLVAGSSVGAFIGAIYCAGTSVSEMEEVARRVRRRHFAQLSVSRYGLFSSRRMIPFLDKVLKARNFEELRVPLAVTATELCTGKGVVLRSGPLSEAVRASCAYPGLFPPVQARGMLLVDGGVTHPVPAEPLLDMHADYVIAVHLKSRTGLGGPRNVFEIITKSFAIAQQQASPIWQAMADLVVEPDVRRFRYDDFEKAGDLVRAGEAAMRAALPGLLQWLERNQIPAIVDGPKQVLVESTS